MLYIYVLYRVCLLSLYIYIYYIYIYILHIYYIYIYTIYILYIIYIIYTLYIYILYVYIQIDIYIYILQTVLYQRGPDPCAKVHWKEEVAGKATGLQPDHARDRKSSQQGEVPYRAKFTSNLVN